jgi:DNA-binding transcriptional LysR family regulator
MRRQNFGELTAFMAVAEERSFTRAAAKLGTSQSTLSQTIRRLETRLDLRLLTRTTRSVAPTEAGERLLETLQPAFEDIDSKLAALTKLREKPAGAVRINATEHVAQTVLWPAIRRLLPDYPDIQVELTGESALTDIVVGRYDAGVRLGELVDKDMIAVRIGPQLRMVAVASPAYFARKPPPRTPHDLAQHDCINLRLPSAGSMPGSSRRTVAN